MFRHLSRLIRSASDGFALTESRKNYRGRRRHGYDTKLRLEQLESRAMLTGEPTIQLAVGSETEEGDSTPVIIWLSHPAEQTVSLTLEIRQAGVVAHADWEVATTSIWIAAGEEYATWDWETIDDLLVEETEYFTFTISNPTNAVLGTRHTQNVTVIDNDNGLVLWWTGGGGSTVTEFSDTILITGGGGTWTGSGIDDQGRAFEAFVTLPELTGTAYIEVIIDGIPSDFGHWTGTGDPDPMIRPWISDDFPMHSEDTLFDGGWSLLFPGVEKFEILTIHHGQDGSAVPDEFEDDIGAFTVANLNNTDGDLSPDAFDDIVQAYTDPQGKQRGINEVDLMRLIVKCPPGYTDGSVVTIFADDNQVQFWDSKIKGGNPHELDPFGSFTISFGTGEMTRELWVEAYAVSNSVRDITIRADYGPKHDTIHATAVWAEMVDYECGTTANMDELDAVLAQEPWSSMPFGTSIPAQLHQYYKGIGIRRIDDPCGIANVILQAWRPLPDGILNEPQVKFDITRRVDDVRFDRIDGDFVQFHDATMYDKLDAANDDDPNKEDEQGPHDGLLFVYDGPGRAGVASEPVTSRADRHNFEEFIRVKVDGKKPSGTGNTPIGSRASLKFEWHSRSQITKTGTAPNRVAARVPAFDHIGEGNDYTTNPQ